MFPNLTRQLHSVSRKPHVFVNTICTAKVNKKIDFLFTFAVQSLYN